MTSLKPCQHCGGEAAQRDFDKPFKNGWVGCQNCRCFIQWIKGGKKEAVQAWNRRHPYEQGRDGGDPEGARISR